MPEPFKPKPVQIITERTEETLVPILITVGTKSAWYARLTQRILTTDGVDSIIDEQVDILWGMNTSDINNMKASTVASIDKEISELQAKKAELEK